MAEDTEIKMIQIPCPKKHYYRLVELRGTNRSWFDFLLRPVIVKDQQEQAMEYEMEEQD